jgi:hypothetical protein
MAFIIVIIIIITDVIIEYAITAIVS